MATAKKPVTEKPAPTGGEDLLATFLASFENFLDQIGMQATQAAKAEQQVLIQSTAESLSGQAVKLTAFIRETAGRLSPVQRVELDRFLKVQDGVAFATRGVAVSAQLMASGVIGNLIHWISQHLKELKKVLSEILHIIFDFLHIPYPDWLDKILQLLDQFLDLLLSLLGDVFGIDFGRTARQLSDQEVNFLHQWAAFEAVRVVRAGGKPSAREEAK